MNSKIKIKDFLETYTKGEQIEMCIPLIQRNYKWKSGKEFSPNERGKRNTAHNLIWEIIDNFKNKKDMTLGIVVLYDETQPDGKIRRLILDGQQRIITLSLIVRYLVGRINSARINSDSEGCTFADEWFGYTFERDFDTEGKRHKFMFSDFSNSGLAYSHVGPCPNNNCSSYNSVDIRRMDENTQEIVRVINGNQIDCKELLNYIKENVFFIVRTTQTPPLDEFLNVNNNKTPFSICDYIKVFLLKDVMEDSALDESEKNKRKEEILGLYHEIASYLYRRVKTQDGKSDSDNELYKLVSEKYTNINKHPSVNRMDIIFEDRYNVDEKGEIKTRYVYDNETGKYKYEIDQTLILEKYEKASDDQTAYDREISHIKYFRNVLRGMEEELYTIDSKGAVHRNSNAFNSFSVLQAYTNKTFFSMFSDDDIKNENDPQAVINRVAKDEFCLQELCTKEIKKKQNRIAINSFIDSIMQSEIIHDKCYKTEKFGISSDNLFDNVTNMFYQVCDEYIDLIKVGKRKNRAAEEQNAEERQFDTDCYSTGNSLELTNGTQSIQNLFGYNIIIPDIQRDYIKGSCASDFLEDIVHKNNKKIIDTYLEENNKMEQIRKNFNNQCYCYIRNYLEQEQVTSEKDACDIVFEMIKNFAIASLNSKSLNTTWAYNKRETLSYLVPALSDNCDYRKTEFKEKFNNMYNFVKQEAEGIVKESALNDEYKYTASCVVGYLEKNNSNLVIYDGQQRLTTFLCAIGYLKRNENRENVKSLNELYKHFVFIGREQANKMIECLFTSTESDDDKLLKKMSEFICDQTTEAIYNLVTTLKEMKDKHTYISYQFFYDRMQVEFYKIDDENETTQLFMDLNDGLALNGSEIYKAEFNHYMTECRMNKSNGAGDSDGSEIGNCALSIQKQLDNEFIDIFIDDREEPEKLEIEYLKKLIEIALIERSNDFLYGSLPKLSEIKNSLTKKDTMDKFLEYIKVFENFYREANVKSNNLGEVDRNIESFIKSKQYSELNKPKNKLYCGYHFEENEKGNILLYSDYNTIEKHYKKKYGKNCDLPNDFRLKCVYDFAVNGYMVTDNYGYLYRIKGDENRNGVKENLRSLLMDMASKDYVGETYAKNEINPKPLVLEKTDDSIVQMTLLAAALKQETDMDIFEAVFYRDSVSIDLSAFSGKIKEKISNENINLYKVLHDNFDLIIYRPEDNEEKIKKIWDGNEYVEFTNAVCIYGICISPLRDESFYKDYDEGYYIKEYNRIFDNENLNTIGKGNKTKREYLFRELTKSSKFVKELIQKGMCEYTGEQNQGKEYRFKHPNPLKNEAILIKQDDWCEKAN